MIAVLGVSFRACVVRSEPCVNPPCAIRSSTRAAAVMHASVHASKQASKYCAYVDQHSEKIYSAHLRQHSHRRSVRT